MEKQQVRIAFVEYKSENVLKMDFVAEIKNGNEYIAIRSVTATLEIMSKYAFDCEGQLLGITEEYSGVLDLDNSIDYVRMSCSIVFNQPENLEDFKEIILNIIQ